LASGKAPNLNSSAASRFDLAVLGGDDPLGGAVLQLLDEREIPVGRLYPLTLRDSDANVAFRGQDWPCEQAAEFDYSRVDALLVTSHSPAASRLSREMRARRPTMPVLTLDDIDPAPAVAVSRVLKTLAALGDGLASVNAFVALPAAIAGQDGVEELANQSRGLFNMESAEPEVFPLQIAFNLVPHGAVGDAPSYESLLADATARLTGGAEAAYSVVWAPIFFGSAIALHARTETSLDIRALRGALAHRDGITLMEAELPAATPTPATDAQGSEAVFVSRIRVDGKLARLWLVFDPIQMEAAQMVAAVENWIDKPANSMLT
jgi:aspartate-semialdehyde dehydrogenase